VLASHYERELQDILEGKIGNKSLHVMYKKIHNKPFFVVRSAGSFNIDLVAISANYTFPIEVKVSKQNKIRFCTTTLKTQFFEFINTCEQAQLIPLYAYRLKWIYKKDPWRIFTVPMNITSKKYLYSRLPKLDLTQKGNYMMFWEKGLPLHEFIEYLCA